MSTVISKSNGSGLTRGQVRWAQEHDWFVDWHMRDGKLMVVVCEICTNLAGERWRNILTISDWQELRAWAGY